MLCLCFLVRGCFVLFCLFLLFCFCFCFCFFFFFGGGGGSKYFVIFWFLMFSFSVLFPSYFFFFKNFTTWKLTHFMYNEFCFHLPGPSAHYHDDINLTLSTAADDSQTNRRPLIMSLQHDTSTLRHILVTFDLKSQFPAISFNSGSLPYIAITCIVCLYILFVARKVLNGVAKFGATLLTHTVSIIAFAIAINLTELSWWEIPMLLSLTILLSQYIPSQRLPISNKAVLITG